MKKTLLFISLLSLGLIASAQAKITFESAEIGSTGGATAMWGGGTVDVIANTYTTGNPSTKVLHVLNTNYLPIYFENFAIPAGAETMYSKLRVKYLIIGGSDINYPTLEIFSSVDGSVADATTKIGELGWASLWGDAEIGVWKTIEFTLASSLLKPVPAGNLILKLSKSNTEYLIDDIELVALPVASSTIIVNDFESNALTDVINMRRWSPTDASATVMANPTDANTKSVHVLATNWNSAVRNNVVLPVGKVLADYDKLQFDIYLNNIEETDNGYKNIEVYVGETKVIDSQSAGTANAWETKEYTLDNLAGGNTFMLDLGLSTNKGNYYLDNIKLQQKTSTSINETNANPLIIYRAGHSIRFNQNVDAVQLFDVNGRMLISAKNVSSLDANNLNAGVYIIKANIAETKYITKIVY